MGSSCSFASRETSGHKSGGLVSVLALGLSTCPKNARDLTEGTSLNIINAIYDKPVASIIHNGKN
jgi:hypothetical protein